MMSPWDSHNDRPSRATRDASPARERPAKAVSYRLEQLLAECDPDAPEIEEVQAWQEAPTVGREEV